MTDSLTDLLDRLAREAPAPVARVAYGQEPQQFGDLRLPQAASAHALYPVVIAIHGGYWRARYDLGYFGAVCGALAAAGLASWNIEYRRIGDPGGGWPGTFEDVAAATDALRSLAARYPLDLSRVVALGHSAGGQLALWLAARLRLPRASSLWQVNPLPLRGVVSLAGVTDLRRAWELRLSEGITSELLGGDPDQVPERYASGSPFDLAPLGAPHSLIHGTRDTDVPFELSQRYVERARTLGDDARLVPLEGLGHFEAVTPSTAAWRLVQGEILRLARGG